MSVVSIPDENIDYDSSFEVVDEDTIEKIESLDETKSESFQFMSATGDATKEANIDSNKVRRKLFYFYDCSRII